MERIIVFSLLTLLFGNSSALLPKLEKLDMTVENIEPGRNDRVVKLRENEVLYAQEKTLTVYNLTTHFNQTYAIWSLECMFV